MKWSRHSESKSSMTWDICAAPTLQQIMKAGSASLRWRDAQFGSAGAFRTLGGVEPRCAPRCSWSPLQGDACTSCALPTRRGVWRSSPPGIPTTSSTQACGCHMRNYQPLMGISPWCRPDGVSAIRQTRGDISSGHAHSTDYQGEHEINMNESITTHGATLSPALIDAECRCGAHINEGDLSFQPIGLPILFCVGCGLAATGLDQPVGHTTEEQFDIVGQLRSEYAIRLAVGWETPEAALVADPDRGLMWLFDAIESEADCIARGLLSGDRIEVTLYQPLSTDPNA